MANTTWFENLNRRILACHHCPRLRDHCTRVAHEKRAAYRHEVYHGRPVANFGDPTARLLVVGLAPGAHGANRTGRMFTGDRSGEFLYRAMHEAGFANQPTSIHQGDRLKLDNAMITAVVHCAPPDNKPKAVEIEACDGYLQKTFEQLRDLSTVVCLGRLAFARTVAYLRRCGPTCAVRQGDFRHGASFEVGKLAVLCSYHPSQQNTFTGRLTRAMLRDVFVKAQKRLS